MVSGISKPLDHNEPFELESDNEAAEGGIGLQLAMQDKLAFEKEMNSKMFVKKELAIFEVKDNHGANLESCYENLNSIPPSSVEPKGIFSGCGRTVTKMRAWTC
jgi:hypothetical protein